MVFLNIIQLRINQSFLKIIKKSLNQKLEFLHLGIKFYHIISIVKSNKLSNKTKTKQNVNYRPNRIEGAAQ